MRFPTLSLLSLLLLQWPIVAHAQIVPDRTLDALSIVTPNGNTQIITGGTGAADNLFHSFRDFSVGDGTVAIFQHAPNIGNLLIRVTGNSISDIQGTIQTSSDPNDSTQRGQANLFILNPNGIVFGPNAKLDIGGSFMATTANSIRLSNGSEFSATNPTEPLLTIAVPAGLQFGSNPGSIVNQAALPWDLDPTINAGLSVPTGKSLALIGGNIEMSNGYLLTSPGNIILAAFGADSQVDLAFNNGLELLYNNLSSLSDIVLKNSSGIYTDGSEDNTIHFIGKNVSIVDTYVNTVISSPVTGASIQVDAANLTVSGFGTELATFTLGEGLGGAININVDNVIELNDGAKISSSTLGTATGNAGNITTKSQTLILSGGGEINSITETSGNSGKIEITASEKITLSGAIVLSDPQDSSKIFGDPSIISTQSLSSGQSGQLDIQTKNLEILNGAQVVSSAFGEGNAGKMNIQATDILVSGVATTESGDLLLNRNGQRISSVIESGVQDNATGQGAILEINTNNLIVQGGAAIQAATFGAGDAGNIEIIANQSISVIGKSPLPEPDKASPVFFPSGILAFSGGFKVDGTPLGLDTATGKGGNISIKTPSLRLSDDARIVLGSLNPSPDAKGAGDRLTIEANVINLNQRAKLDAATESGNGGNMDLVANQLLLLRNGSQIITQAGSANQGGNGGNIEIRSPFIFAIDTENSDINANAFTGNGGNIKLTATTILGLTPRDQLTPLSDITASSSFGRQGQIIVNSPEPDPNRGTVQLPNALTDPSDRIDQSCSPNSTASGQFTVAGQGGLPSNPQTLIASTPIARLANVPNITKTSINPAPTLTIREAQQIKRLSNGKIRFMADVAQPAAPLLSGSKCQ